MIRYLGRYTHRVGISNQRLVSMDERGVTFRTKDGNALTVDGREMLARVELLTHRCFVRTAKPDEDLWPWDDYGSVLDTAR